MKPSIGKKIVDRLTDFADSLERAETFRQNTLAARSFSSLAAPYDPGMVKDSRHSTGEPGHLCEVSRRIGRCGAVVGIRRKYSIGYGLSVYGRDSSQPDILEKAIFRACFSEGRGIGQDMKPSLICGAALQL